MRTSNKLQGKAWYHGAKVGFMLLFLASFLWVLSLTYVQVNEKVAVIRCDNGKTFTTAYTSLSPEQKVQIYKQCDPVAYYIASSAVRGTLSQESGKMLYGMILESIKNGATDADLHSAVDAFKTKYAQADRKPSDSLTREQLSTSNGPTADVFVVKKTTWTANYQTEFVDRYKPMERAALYLESLLTVVLLFWLFSRIFFSIVAGEKFLKWGF